MAKKECPWCHGTGVCACDSECKHEGPKAGGEACFCVDQVPAGAGRPATRGSAGGDRRSVPAK